MVIGGRYCCRVRLPVYRRARAGALEIAEAVNLLALPIAVFSRLLRLGDRLLSGCTKTVGAAAQLESSKSVDRAIVRVVTLTCEGSI